MLIVGARERARKIILRGSREEGKTEEGERQGGGGRNGARGTREVQREV